MIETKLVTALARATAFILVNAEIGKENEVLEMIKAFPEVVEAYNVYGVYDIIIKVEAENMQVIKNTVLLKIRQMNNVRSTFTMMVI
jgi:DNA-binding Lrp family transcriptional regulator